MADLRDFYQETILEHYRNPRNLRKLEHTNREADGQNPLCGDKLSVYIHIDNNTLMDISFTGSGCAIFMASASMMTESLKGKTVEEANAIFERFSRILIDPLDSPKHLSILGSLAVFSGVREYPGRVRCATLPWHTMNSALKRLQDAEATE